MSKRGPKPKSNVVRLLEGSRRPLNDDEIAIELPAVKPAIVAVDPLASAEWDRVVGIMPFGMYSAAHESALSAHALAWSMLNKAQSEIAERGLTVVMARGAVTNPAVKVWKLAADTLHRTSGLLGLHPGARIGPPRSSETPFGGKFAGLLGKN